MKIETHDIFEFSNIYKNADKLYKFAWDSNTTDKEISMSYPNRFLSVWFCLNADEVGHDEFNRQISDEKTQEEIHINFAKICKFVKDNLHNVFEIKSGEYGELVGVSSDLEDFYYVYNVLDYRYKTDKDLHFKRTKRVVFVSSVGIPKPFNCEQIIYIKKQK